MAQFAAELDIDSRRILGYEPLAINETPLLYTLFAGFTRDPRGGLVVMTYQLVHRLCVARADQANSEALTDDYVDAVPEAIEINPQLSAAITNGIAEISRATAFYMPVNDIVYRMIEFTSTVVTKRARLDRVAP